MTSALVVPHTAGAQDVGTGVLSFDPATPVAWEHLDVGVSVSGCDTALSNVEASVYIQQGDGDAVTVHLVASASLPVTGGAGAGTIPVPTAYPGTYEVYLGGCDGHSYVGYGVSDLTFEVAPPPDFTLAATADHEARIGEPVTVSLAGTGCPSDQVDWRVGVPTGFGTSRLATGVAVPVDGAWQATGELTISEGDMYGARLLPIEPTVHAEATCLVDGVLVHYEAVELPLLPAVVDPPVVDPRYAG